VLIQAPGRVGLVTPMSGERMNDWAVDYVCRTEVNSSSTRIASLIVPWSVPTDCPTYHRSYPAGSKRKENATVKSGALWRSFDFEEALRATNQYGTGKIPTKLPGNGFWTTAIDSSKTWKVDRFSTWRARGRLATARS